MFESVLFTMMLMVTTGIAMNLFAIELNGVFSLQGLNAILASLFILMLMFGYCFASECVTSDLMEIGDIFYNSPWYRLPLKQQKLLTLPIQQAQREFRLSGLGLVDCSLEVFSSVKLNTAIFGSFLSLADFFSHFALIDFIFPLKCRLFARPSRISLFYVNSNKQHIE